LFFALAQVAPPADTNVEIELSVWKWVVIIGASAIVLIYAIKRLADVVTKKKTDSMIRRVVGEDPSQGGEDGWDDMKKLDDDLDES
jgi:hypothetical protein